MSYLMGFNMGRLRRNFNLMTYTQLHNRLGHPGYKKLEKKLRITLLNLMTSMLKNLRVVHWKRAEEPTLKVKSMIHRKNPGESLYLDTSWTNMKSG